MMLLMTCNLSWIESLVDIVETICAIGNLVLLIYFTNREWSYSKKKEEHMEAEAVSVAKLERQKLWYDKIVIERIVEYFLEYFDNTDKAVGIKKVQTDEEKRKLIENMKLESRRYKHLIIPCLEIFSHELTQKTNHLLQDYCDILIQEVDKRETMYTYDFERKLNDKKGEILKMVYEYDFKNHLQEG